MKEVHWGTGEGARIDIVMTGTDPGEQGGIASVVTALLDAGLFQRYTGLYIVSHVGRGYWAKAKMAVLALVRMCWVCWTRRPAVVHAHCSTGASFIRKSLLLSVARRFGCATVLHLHGSRFRQYARDDAGRLRQCFIARTLRRSSAVIALSESWAEFVRELAPGVNVRVIGNAVPLPPEPMPRMPEPFRILFLGQIGPRKGIHDLVAAVARLKTAFPRVRLAVGGGGDLPSLRTLIASHGLEKHVELLGWIVSPEMERQLQRAAVFCLPSYNEGLPMAMLEAMAAGLPVVVTPVGGIPEVIADGINGLLVPPGDIEALASALRRTLEDMAGSRRMGLRARQTVLDRYHVQGMVERLAALYGELGLRCEDGEPGALPWGHARGVAPAEARTGAADSTAELICPCTPLCQQCLTSRSPGSAPVPPPAPAAAAPSSR